MRCVLCALTCWLTSKRLHCSLTVYTHEQAAIIIRGMGSFSSDAFLQTYLRKFHCSYTVVDYTKMVHWKELKIRIIKQLWSLRYKYVMLLLLVKLSTPNHQEWTTSEQYFSFSTLACLHVHKVLSVKTELKALFHFSIMLWTMLCVYSGFTCDMFLTCWPAAERGWGWVGRLTWSCGDT